MADSKICMTEAEFQIRLNEAAEKGAEKALEKLGLSDQYAGEDIRNLRGLLKSFREARKTAWRTAVQLFTTALFGALMAGVALKMGLHR